MVIPHLLLPARLLLFAVLLSSATSAAQLDCRISDVSPSARTLKVSCALTQSSSSDANQIEFRFRNRFAGVERLSERIFALKFTDADGRQLRPEILGDGAYRLALHGEPRLNFNYELRLTDILEPGQYALVSSLGPQAGFLLLADALPRVYTSYQDQPQKLAVRLQLSLPESWKVATTETERDGLYEIADAEQAVFFIGQVRDRVGQAGKRQLTAALVGAWSFSDDQAGQIAAAIAREQAAMIGGQEHGKFLVTLAPFPLPLTGLRSTALTRGRSVILLLNPDADATRTRKLYQKQLAHEMFHFYLPGAFAVRENFDWFWEGFTRYMGIVTLLRLRLIGPRDYFDMLGEEFEAYLANPARARTSLVAASADKFASRENYELVYRKGTLVAALYDLSLRWQSGGRRSVNDVMRALYQNYARSGRPVGNSEVIEELNRAGDFKRFLADYVSGTREVDLAALLKPYGLSVEQTAATQGRVRISPALKPSDKQRTLLDSFNHEFTRIHTNKGH